MDAVTHCIESYSSLLGSSPFTEALCLEALQMLFKYLPVATVHGEDLEARSATLTASCMAGVAFTNSGVGIVHALAHATGARFGTHHGATNSVFLPFGMSFNQQTISSRFATIARFLKISDNRNDDAAGQALIDATRRLAADLGLPARLRDLGVPPFANGSLEELADLASCDPAIMFNPRESSRQDIMDIYQNAY
jgi:alcohol dehydrogenase class IV